MTRFVIGPDVADRLAADRLTVHNLVAPAVIKSELLERLYAAVRRGELSKGEAERRLDFVRGLKVRYLSDRVSQSVAWRIAEQQGWADTRDAEYVAVAQLQADAFVTLDDALAGRVAGLVTVAPFEALQH